MIRDLWEKVLEFVNNNNFLRENQSNLKKIGIIAGIVVAILIAGVWNKTEDEPLIEETMPLASEEPVSDIVIVDIGGAVNNPTVARLSDGSRVEDAIEAAGGLRDDANLDEINRAAFVNDGDKIFIPSKSDEPEGRNGVNSLGGIEQVGTDGKININTADSEQLQELTGVGPATADKIIDYRESNGRFTQLEDLKKVSGIGDKTYEKLKDEIRV